MSASASLDKTVAGKNTATRKPPSSAVKVFLLGMMGSGKSFWADKLKKKLKVPAYDLDALIEMMEERTISEIFAEDGEAFFRKEEAKMLRWFKEKKQFILSCGGGTPCFNDNMQWMNKNGITVFINEPVDVLVNRLQQQKDHRPLISNLSDSQLHEFITQKLSERLPYYNQSTHILTGDQLNETAFTKLLKQYA